MAGGLVIAGRVFGLASDDFVLPSLTGLLLHLSWLCLSCYLYIYRPTVDCDLRWLDIYLPVCMLFQASEVILDGSVLWTTLQGTVSNDRPRKHMGKLLISSAALKVPELVLLVY
jgi:hypothetical protein